jgi:hypothetical protein
VLKFNLDAVNAGTWFEFFTSHIDPATGDVVYDDPMPGHRVKIRSTAPFWEERIKNRKRERELAVNPKTKVMEKVSSIKELTLAESKAENDDAIDYSIVEFDNMVDSSGSVIKCTRENKLKLMRIPVFDRFYARCSQILRDTDGYLIEEEKKT